MEGCNSHFLFRMGGAMIDNLFDYLFINKASNASQAIFFQASNSKYITSNRGFFRNPHTYTHREREMDKHLYYLKFSSFFIIKDYYNKETWLKL